GAAGRPTKTYSGGIRRRLDLPVSLIATPPVLFLDEPTTGLDPRSRLAMWEIIKNLLAGGTTILLTTQYLDEADQLADRIVVIDGGKVIAEGTPDALKSKVDNDRQAEAGGSRGGQIVTAQLVFDRRPQAVLAVNDSLIMIRRSCTHIIRNTDQLLGAFFQPIMFLVLFAAVFGGAISKALPPGTNYLDFLMPGIIVQTLAFGSTTTAVAICNDLQK